MGSRKALGVISVPFPARLFDRLLKSCRALLAAATTRTDLSAASAMAALSVSPETVTMFFLVAAFLFFLSLVLCSCHLREYRRAKRQNAAVAESKRQAAARILSSKITTPPPGPPVLLAAVDSAGYHDNYREDMEGAALELSWSNDPLGHDDLDRILATTLEMADRCIASTDEGVPKKSPHFADTIKVVETFSSEEYDRGIKANRVAEADIPDTEAYELGALHIRRLLNAHARTEQAEQHSASPATSDDSARSSPVVQTAHYEPHLVHDIEGEARPVDNMTPEHIMSRVRSPPVQFGSELRLSLVQRQEQLASFMATHHDLQLCYDGDEDKQQQGETFAL